MITLRRWEIPHHTNQKPNMTGITGQGLYTGSMSFVSPNQKRQSTEGMHVHKTKKKIRIDLGSLSLNSSPLLTRLAASTFNQLGQYANSPGHRAYC